MQEFKQKQDFKQAQTAEAPGATPAFLPALQSRTLAGLQHCIRALAHSLSLLTSSLGSRQIRG